MGRRLWMMLLRGMCGFFQGEFGLCWIDVGDVLTV